MSNDPVLKTNSKEAFVGKEYIRDDKGKIIGSRITSRAYENLVMFEGGAPVVQLAFIQYDSDGKSIGTVYLNKCNDTYEAETAFEELRTKLTKEYYQSPASKENK